MKKRKQKASFFGKAGHHLVLDNQLTAPHWRCKQYSQRFLRGLLMVPVKMFWKQSMSRDSFCCLLPVCTHTDRGTSCISQTFPFKRAQSLCTVLFALLNVEGWYGKKTENSIVTASKTLFWFLSRRSQSFSWSLCKVASYINSSIYWLSVHNAKKYPLQNQKSFRICAWPFNIWIFWKIE